MTEKKNALGFRGPRMMNKTTRIDFGWYKGKTLGEVMEYDAQYLLWAIEKNIIDVEPHLLDDIDDAEQEQNTYSEYWPIQDPLHPFED